MLNTLKLIWREKRWYSWIWFSLLLSVEIFNILVDTIIWKATIQQNLLLTFVSFGLGSTIFIDWYKKNNTKLIKWGLLILALLLISNIIYLVIKS
jgi:hypothetical protein